MNIKGDRQRDPVADKNKKGNSGKPLLLPFVFTNYL